MIPDHHAWWWTTAFADSTQGVTSRKDQHCQPQKMFCVATLYEVARTISWLCLSTSNLRTNVWSYGKAKEVWLASHWTGLFIFTKLPHLALPFQRHGGVESEGTFFALCIISYGSHTVDWSMWTTIFVLSDQIHDAGHSGSALYSGFVLPNSNLLEKNWN